MKLVLFDCDGTLVDSAGLIHEVMRHTFIAFGKPEPAIETTKSIIGLTLDIAIARMDGKPHADDEAVAMASHYKAIFADIRRDSGFGETMFDGIREVLDALIAREDVWLGAVTGKSRRGLETILEGHGLKPHFLVCRTADDCPSKPHPAMVTECCDEAGIAPRETIVIGDAIYDMQMAKAAGATAIGVAWGYAKAHDLWKAGADAVVERPADLLAYIHWELLMRDELSQDIFGTFIPEPSHEDPVRRAQIQMKRPLPKRFYESVGMEEREEGFSITLDGKSVKTPAKNLLTLPNREAAELVVAEWAGQGEFINPATMPITKLANTAIDAVSNSLDDVFDEIVRFAGTDLLCYRADGPKELIDRQSARWDPLLAWVSTAHGARFILVEGVMHQEQPQEAIGAYARALERYRDPFQISCLNVVTTLTGSAVLTLAFAEGAFDLDEVWSLAHLDEDWTIEHWGSDAEAESRREARYSEFASAASLFAALQAAS